MEEGALIQGQYEAKSAVKGPTRASIDEKNDQRKPDNLLCCKVKDGWPSG